MNRVCGCGCVHTGPCQLNPQIYANSSQAHYSNSAQLQSMQQYYAQVERFDPYTSGYADGYAAGFLAAQREAKR